MKKLVIYLLLLSFVLVGCSGEKKEKLQASELTDQYQLVTQTEELSEGQSTMSLSYPVVKDLIDKRIEDKINETIKNRVEEYKGLCGLGEDMGIQETSTVRYEVPYKSKEKLSIKFYIESQMEDEMSDIIIDTYTFDLNSAEDLFLSELFKNKKYKKKINSILKEKFDSLEVETIKEFVSIEETQGYYLKGNSLVIYFQTLDYTMDEPLEFEIPLDDLKDILKKPIPEGEIL
ncbi:MAG TPA: DUF3298 domain-containing protein [Acetivibrio sp.]|nr:DUF3298 domain-containing protein [Acetivibrio sp.]